MKIGLINQLHGASDGRWPSPTWESLRERALAAEAVGFDSFVYEDALLYRNGESSKGSWAAVAIGSALAAVTSRIGIGTSVMNAPYRSAAMMANIAQTIDEVSGGRFIFGIGCGNTPTDYEAFGFPTDHRVSRFEEALQIIHGLLKEGTVNFEGRFHSAKNSELALNAPRPQGPPIIVAAGKPRMLRLAARYGDVWNWWTYDSRGPEQHSLNPIIDELERACDDEGRDPSTLGRCLDFYSVDALRDGDNGAAVTGSAAEIAERLLAFRVLGFDEVRCDVQPWTTEGIQAMEDVVKLVHAA